MSTIKLKAPEGTKSASVGGTEYVVDAKGNVDVPADQAINLYAFGFHGVPEDEAATDAPADAQEEGGKGGSTKAKK